MKVLLGLMEPLLPLQGRSRKLIVVTLAYNSQIDAKSNQEGRTMKSKSTATKSKKRMVEHLEVLRNYATLAIGNNQILNSKDQSDKDERMAEFLTIGKSLKMDYKDLVAQVLDGTLSSKRPECGCPTCQSRVDKDQRPIK